MKIIELSSELLSFMNQANQPFPIIGRIIPALTDGRWSYSEELFSSPVSKSYPADDTDYSEYLNRDDRIVFLAFSDDECTGQIVLRADWNRYALIEDLAVAALHRGNGIGTALIQHAVQWAKDHHLNGLCAETQDNNLLACRFYAKCGFRIGAVNTMLYANFEKPYSDETAIFWYLKF